VRKGDAHSLPSGGPVRHARTSARTKPYARDETDDLDRAVVNIDPSTCPVSLRLRPPSADPWHPVSSVGCLCGPDRACPLCLHETSLCCGSLIHFIPCSFLIFCQRRGRPCFSSCQPDAGRTGSTGSCDCTCRRDCKQELIA
jgi:hypothetical protein